MIDMICWLRFLIVVIAAMACTNSTAQNNLDAAGRIVAIGDIHGDFDALIEVLKLGGVIDSKNKWSGDKTNLVQTGDLPDRGPDTRKVIEFLMNLEKQAKKAGGAVHVLIGNHDAMNIYGDLRYTTAAEFSAFKGGESAELRNAYYQRIVDQSKPADEAAFKKKFEAETPLGWVEQRQAWSAKGTLGKWTLGHDAVLKIGDTLFVHGGISARVAAMSIEEINRTIRAELSSSDPAKIQSGLTGAEDGPLWYRGLVNDPEDKAAETLELALKNFGVSRIVVGHTPTKAPIVSRLGGKLIDIDVGLSRFYGGPKDCLIIEGQKLYTMRGGTKTPLN